MSQEKKSMKKSELIALHNVFAKAKFKLDQQPCIDLLHLKIKISEEGEKIDKLQDDAVKTILAEFGCESAKDLPKDKIADFEEKLTGVMNKMLSETVELDTHILTPDQLFSGILDLDENKDMSTEGKAILMKYLMK